MKSLIRGTTAASATFRSHAMQQRLPPALREAQAIEQRNTCYGSNSVLPTIANPAWCEAGTPEEADAVPVGNIAQQDWNRQGTAAPIPPRVQYNLSAARQTTWCQRSELHHQTKTIARRSPLDGCIK